MIVNTSELTGAALDWAVAYALNGKPEFFKAFGAAMLGRSITGAVLAGNIHPSTSWSQCGPLIDEYGIEFKWVTDATIEAYSYTLSENRVFGQSHLQAACLLLAYELGDTVDVPEGLL